MDKVGIVSDELELTPEIEELAKNANKYAKTVKEPREQKEQEKKIEEFKEVISSERELLKLFSKNRLNLEIVYNQQLLKFKIKPLTSTEDIEAVGLDFRTYMDLTDLEKEIILKKNQGETLTPEEQKIYNKKEEEFTSGAMGNMLDQANNILATFLTPPSYSSVRDPKKRMNRKLNFWRGMPFDLKMFLFTEVINRLGINPEVDLKLFQTN
jgi:hypothetical protein